LYSVPHIVRAATLRYQAERVSFIRQEILKNVLVVNLERGDDFGRDTC